MGACREGFNLFNKGGRKHFFGRGILGNKPAWLFENQPRDTMYNSRMNQICPNCEESDFYKTNITQPSKQIKTEEQLFDEKYLSGELCIECTVKDGVPLKPIKQFLSQSNQKNKDEDI